jgi:hypothetical protein
MVTIMISDHIQVQGLLLSVDGETARVAVGSGEAVGRLLPSLRRVPKPVPRVTETA